MKWMIVVIVIAGPNVKEFRYPGFETEKECRDARFNGLNWSVSEGAFMSACVPYGVWGVPEKAN